MSELAEQWSLPERARPPLLGELVERIDEAMATARASEAAVMTVGAAALDAAEQAERAAGLAQRASEAIGAGVAPGAPAPPPAGGRAANAMAVAPAARPEPEELVDFNARADRVAERLQRLRAAPLTA